MRAQSRRIGHRVARPNIFIERQAGFATGQRKLGAEVPIEVPVGKMMHHLTDGPASGPIRGIELSVGKMHHRGTQLCGSFRYLR
jgi:hypothetical protein